MLVLGKWDLVPFRKSRTGRLKLPGVAAASEVGLGSLVIPGKSLKSGPEPQSPETPR